MNALAKAFKHDGFAFQLLKRKGDVALFAKSKPGHSCETFEVVIVQTHPTETIRGRDYPEREAMPPSETWGTFGWTYNELDGAKIKFRALAKSRSEPHFQHADIDSGAFSCSDRVAIAEGNPCATTR